MKVISSPFLPPGTVLIVNPSVLSMLGAMPLPDFEPPVPYDRSLVPDGHVPKLMLSEGIDVPWRFRVEFNNWLLERFGTKPKPYQLRSIFDYEFRMGCPLGMLRAES